MNIWILGWSGSCWPRFLSIWGLALQAKALSPNYEIKRTPEVTLRSNHHLRPAPLISALDFMTNVPDGLCKLYIDLPNHWMYKGESIWAKELGDNEYELQNVPFCAYGLNCGDVVAARSEGDGLKPMVHSVVRRSGNRTLRVMFEDHVPKDLQAPHIVLIEGFGAWVERASASYICINLPPSCDYPGVCRALERLERKKGSFQRDL